MEKRTPQIIEILLGAILTLIVAFAFRSKTSFIETTVSLPIYDYFSMQRKASFDTSAVQIVEIDETSTKTLGRWPWPRSLQADLLDQVVTGGAKIIGLNVIYGDADQSDAAEKIMEISSGYKTLLEKHRPILKRARINTVPFDDFAHHLDDVQNEINSDALLQQSIEEASNVVLPMYFTPGEPVENLEPLPTTLPQEKMASVAKDPLFPTIPVSLAASLPLDIFVKAAGSIGHCNLSPDPDGTIRRIFPLMRYGDTFYPSFAIQLIRHYRNIFTEPMTWKSDEGFILGKISIPSDQTGGTFIQYAGPSGTFQRFTALDVLSDNIPKGAFEKKIVLIGVTATGGAENFVVPGGERMTGLEIWANHIQNMLSRNYIVQPFWGPKLEWGMIILSGLVVMLILPMARARFSVPISIVVLLSGLLTSYTLFIKKGLWVTPAYGAFLLMAGFIVLIAKRLVFTERGKELVEAESVETNKMLGLSFQGQGLLDLAFEKFRKCPVDNSMKELLYNLGLDMERKRQFSKAAAVYEHIAANDPKYKDVKDKIELLKKAGDGAIFGPLGKKGSDSTVVVEGLSQNTTLGRYEVIKELGRGAMGIVYLGRDPKINRQVAIKTLRFEEDLDEEQTKSTKERFFREAESAGNLTHPNIIRIFDAGEDQDVAYIAMELLEGQDLKKLCEKAHLLPIETTMDYVAKIADALDFAHKQGVVHRDIKPGNIMLLKDQTLRITDFGIARIQASSKTATGAVLGTPAYMSPEQVNGKKVDGRADIFSLGVTFYELLTGEKPFQADSIAALLFRIANVEPANPKDYNPNIPGAILPILKKCLAKTVEERYQTAAELANDLRDCLRTLKYGSTEAYKPLSSGSSGKQDNGTAGTGFYSELEQTFNIRKPESLESVELNETQKTVVDQVEDLLGDKTLVDEKTQVDDQNKV